MSEPVSISRGIAARYATAVFELAKESKTIESLDGDVAVLSAALSESDDLNALISSPVVSREQSAAAIAGLAKKAKLSDVISNTLALMAQKRRLFVLPQLVLALEAMLADERGEVTAEVVSAKALTKTQETKLTKSLSEQFGKTVTLNATVDEAIIGGLIIKVGSKMIDTSIASKLNSLQNAMKEVG